MLYEKLIIDDYAQFKFLTIFFDRWCSIYFNRILDGKDSKLTLVIKDRKNMDVYENELSDISIDQIVNHHNLNHRF